MDAAPVVPPLAEPVELPPLAAWEREALRKLRLLRQSRKPAILFVTENGAIQVYRGERDGLIGA